MEKSDEMKRKLDEFWQENLGLFYEDMRVDEPNKKQGIMGFFEILEIEEQEVVVFVLKDKEGVSHATTN